jgi:hypothetical protein
LNKCSSGNRQSSSKKGTHTGCCYSAGCCYCCICSF